MLKANTKSNTESGDDVCKDSVNEIESQPDKTSATNNERGTRWLFDHKMSWWKYYTTRLNLLSLLGQYFIVIAPLINFFLWHIVDPLLVQITANKAEIDRRIAAFLKKKQLDVDVHNQREFCNLLNTENGQHLSPTLSLFWHFAYFVYELWHLGCPTELWLHYRARYLTLIALFCVRC